MNIYDVSVEFSVCGMKWNDWSCKSWYILTHDRFFPCHPNAAQSISLRAVNKKCNKVFNMTQKAFQFYLLPRSMFVSFSRSCCNSRNFPFVWSLFSLQCYVRFLFYFQTECTRQTLGRDMVIFQATKEYVQKRKQKWKMFDLNGVEIHRRECVCLYVEEAEICKPLPPLLRRRFTFTIIIIMIFIWDASAWKNTRKNSAKNGRKTIEIQSQIWFRISSVFFWLVGFLFCFIISTHSSVLEAKMEALPCFFHHLFIHYSALF